MREPKADGKRRTETLIVKLTTEEKERFSAAAEADGLELSTWLRRVGVLAARKAGRGRS